MSEQPPSRLFGFIFPNDLKAAAATRAAAQEISLGELIRRAITAYLGEL